MPISGRLTYSLMVHHPLPSKNAGWGRSYSFFSVRRKGGKLSADMRSGGMLLPSPPPLKCHFNPFPRLPSNELNEWNNLKFDDLFYLTRTKICTFLLYLHYSPYKQCISYASSARSEGQRPRELYSSRDMHNYSVEMTCILGFISDTKYPHLPPLNCHLTDNTKMINPDQTRHEWCRTSRNWKPGCRISLPAKQTQTLLLWKAKAVKINLKKEKSTSLVQKQNVVYACARRDFSWRLSNFWACSDTSADALVSDNNYKD